MKKKIYIGCSLTHATEEFKSGIELLKNKLRSDYEILDFLGLTKGTPQDVYKWDINNVRTCDLFIADCTYPSTGLGMEIGAAIENDKPTLIVAHEDAKVTRIVLGITHPKFTFHRYNDPMEVAELIKERVKTI